MRAKDSYRTRESGNCLKPSLLLSVIAGPESWDPETGHVRLMSRWWRWFMGYVSNYDPEKVEIIVDIEREVQVAHARSLAIRRAKMQKPTFAAQVDTDVQIEPTPERLIELLEDDQRRGFGMVTSPGMSSEGIFEVSFDTKKVKPSDTEPFPIDRSWGGFLSFSRRAYLDMPALGYVHSISNVKIDTYCQSIPYQPCPHCGVEIEGMGEDIALIRQGQKGGAALCADPRILTTHLKVAGLKSYRPGMRVIDGNPNDMGLRAPTAEH